MARVQLQHVDKTFRNGVRAVRDLSFDVSHGEFFVLVGPSGSGKTTTLRLVAGLDQPTAGDIFIDDQLVNQIPPAKREIAMVFQNAALYPHMTVGENIAFGLKTRRLAKLEMERRLREAASWLSIDALLNRRPAELSGGERSRVAVARAIVRRPRVLLFDEPLIGLDAPQRAQLRLELARLPAMLGATILYVTHDQAEAMTLGDRICVIDRGVVQQIDTPLRIYEGPSNTFVAAFIGTPGMNLIPGIIQQGTFQLKPAAGDGIPASFVIKLDAATQDGSIVLGIRPHELTIGAGSQPLATVTVDRVERLGHEMALYFELAGGRHSARVAADAGVQAGQQVPLSLRTDSVHLFSAIDGRRLN